MNARDGHQKQFASKVLVGLTHLKGSKVAFDNLGRGADKSEGGFDSHYRYMDGVTNHQEDHYLWCKLWNREACIDGRET